MIEPAIGKLERVQIRDLWKHEERGFSRWLFENPEILSDVVGFPIEMLEREKWVGTFKVDLVGETGSGELVVVENQLESSNHDHLGKLLTYATNLDAKRTIWIVTAARPEHVKAISWLNESTPTDMAFYLVKLEAFKIGDSPVAPFITLIVGPSADSKAIGKKKKELAERHVLRFKFWEQLLSLAKQEGMLLHANRAPTNDNWISAGAGRAGFSWTYVAWLQKSTAVELYIDTGDQAKNKSIFNLVEAQRAIVESEFGAPLEWERLDSKRSCRIRHKLNSGGLQSPESEWPAIQAQMVDAMRRLSKALQAKIAALPF